jgi:hypothetical protein
MSKTAQASAQENANQSLQRKRNHSSWLWLIAFLALVIYSCTLLRLEAQTSQDHVRPYFSDVLSSVPFFAVNTTLSSLLQFSAAMLLFFAASSASRPGRQCLLYAFQGFLLLYTAADDRFMFHERLSTFLDVGDGWLMLALTGLNLCAYLALFKSSYFNLAMLISLIFSAILFFMMMVFDTILPEKMFLRLSLEDLSKTWAAFFLFTFGWAAAKFSHSVDPRPLKIPDVLLPIIPAYWREAI